jgi:uncharacterized RDD family membrane protein YckC
MTGAVPTLSIRTPEGVSFHLLLAGTVPRFLAWAVDAVAVAFVANLARMLTFFFTLLDPGVGAAITVIIYFVLSIGYGIFFEWVWRGQTPGKRLLRLRVMDLHGLRLQFSQVAIRNLLRAVDMLPAFYLVGGAASLLNPRWQRLGDIAANTIVVRIPKSIPPEIEDLAGSKYNSLRDYPHLEARLRQAVSPAEAALALDSLRRARTLEAPERVRIFEDLASYFQEIVEFPPEATDMIGAEQYVRNVADVIYRAPKARVDSWENLTGEV